MSEEETINLSLTYHEWFMLMEWGIDYTSELEWRYGCRKSDKMSNLSRNLLSRIHSLLTYEDYLRLNQKSYDEEEYKNEQ